MFFDKYIPTFTGKSYMINDWSYQSSIDYYVPFRTMATTFANLDKNMDMLYLEPGMGPWIIGLKSPSRYFFPLPVQRSKYNPTLRETDSYKELLEQINNYDGKYILLDPLWFDLSDKSFDDFHKNLINYSKFTITGSRLELFIKNK